MNKQVIISDVLSKLNQMGINYKIGEGTDVSIGCEFLDASWGTSSKYIGYNALVYFDESSQTVFMWEMTKEKGSGISFRGDSGTSFQSGTTLFRKVKSIQYGFDGKAYEYSLDLGAIPKAFKEAAKQYGWRFKTVLNRDNASYPRGYAPPGNVSDIGKSNIKAPEQIPPVQINNMQPQNQSFSDAATPPPPPTFGNQQQGYIPQGQYNNPNMPFYSQGGSNTAKVRTGVFYWILFAVLALFDILIIIGGSNIIFMGLASVVLIIMVVLGKSFSRGIIRPILSFVGALIVTFVIFALTGTGESSFNISFGQDNTQKIAGFSLSIGNKGVPDVVAEGFSRSVEQKTLKPIDKTKTFKPEDNYIYYSVLVKYLPEKTEIMSKWYYEGSLIMESEADKMEKALDNQYYSASLERGEKPFPTGRYNVELIISKDGKEIYKCTDEFAVAAN